MKKIALVTGASSGIGKEVAIGLAKAGMHVILVCRDLKKGQMALEEVKSITHSESIDLLLADLSSQADVHRLAKTIIERYPTLHVLVNNAGIVLYNKTLSIDGIEMTLAVNHLGPFYLTLLLQKLLARSATARVINVSSAIHKWAKLDLDDLQYNKRKYHFMKAYAQSKLLMTMMTAELSRQFLSKNITVNCIHPGAVKTALGSNQAHRFLLKILDKFIKLFFICPKQAANPIIDLATLNEWNKVTGKYFVKGKPAASNPLCDDLALAEKVWVLSNKLIIQSAVKPINC